MGEEERESHKTNCPSPKYKGKIEKVFCFVTLQFSFVFDKLNSCLPLLHKSLRWGSSTQQKFFFRFLLLPPLNISVSKVSKRYIYSGFLNDFC